MKKKIKEEWKPIKGYEGLYEVSNYGRIFSKPRVVKNSGCMNSNEMIVSGRILKQCKDTYGYLIVNILKDGIRTTRKVHLIVWDNFGDKARDGRRLQVDHIDNNKTNNFIGNLQLLTNRENCLKGKKFHKQRSVLSEI